MDAAYMVVFADAEGREIVLSGPVQTAWDAEVQAIPGMHERGLTTATLVRSRDGQRTWEDLRQVVAPPQARRG